MDSDTDLQQSSPPALQQGGAELITHKTTNSQHAADILRTGDCRVHVEVVSPQDGKPAQSLTQEHCSKQRPQLTTVIQLHASTCAQPVAEQREHSADDNAHGGTSLPEFGEVQQVGNMLVQAAAASEAAMHEVRTSDQ